MERREEFVGHANPYSPKDENGMSEKLYKETSEMLARSCQRGLDIATKYEELHALYQEQSAQLTTTQAQLAKAITALGPFAALGKWFGDSSKGILDSEVIAGGIKAKLTVGDLRLASTTLEEIRPAN
jgi:hypothetical protein